MFRRISIIGIGMFFIVSIICMVLAPPAFSETDLNNDGYADIVFANYYNGSSYNINSYAYLGEATNPYSTKTNLATQGGFGNSTADLNNDGYQDIIFSNQYNGTINNINSYVYWGAATNPYSTKTNLATLGASGNSVADLNRDGYLDIVFSNYKSTSSNNVNSYVYWGAATNPYSTKTDLATQGAYGSSVADLNNDGYLDIVFSNGYNGTTRNINSYIYWGAATNPYATKTNLATQGAVGNSVADFNKDGYLDIVFSNYTNGTIGNINSYVYWGAATNPYTTKTDLPTNGAYDNSVADLNRDGYLDIVFANRSGGNSYIYWGAASNPYATKTDLSTGAAYGSSIADLNQDGYLDIVFSNFENANSYVYWGAATNPYSTKTALATVGGYGVSVAGSNIYGANTAFGMVMPLWATQGGYGWDILSSPEYQFIATQYGFLNNGALSFSDEDIAKLTKLYFQGKAGQNPASITIDGLTWTYFPESLGGHSYGDAWYDSGTYNFYMGSGLEGELGGGAVPEPATVFTIIGGLAMAAYRRVCKRVKKG